MEAGELLIRAKPHQPEEEKAIIYEAVGYELIGDKPHAHGLACKLREVYPHNKTLIALWLRTGDAPVELTQLEAVAGKVAERCAEVAMALSFVCLGRGDAERAERYGRLAVKLEPDSPEELLTLGSAVQTRGYQSPRAAEKRVLLEEAKHLYDQTEALAKSRGAVHLQSNAVLNRAVVRALLDEPEAMDDFAIAKSLDPKDPDIHRRLAAYLDDVGQSDRAIAEARAAFDLREDGETTLLLATLLWLRGGKDNQKEALKVALVAIRQTAYQWADELLDLAAEGLQNFDRGDEIEPLMASVPTPKLSAVAHASILARIDLMRRDFDAANQHATRAAEAVTADTLGHDLKRLSWVLLRLERFAEALPILHRTAKLSVLSSATRELLDCANRLEAHDVIMNVCRQLREAGVEERRLLDNEIDILQQYDRDAAIAVLQDHLERYPEDRSARLRLSMQGIMAERHELIQSTFDDMPDPRTTEPKPVGRMAIALLLNRGRSDGRARICLPVASAPLRRRGRSPPLLRRLSQFGRGFTPA